jgi:ubiquitin carboxyl-terminal hydrolase 5/13
MAVEFLFSNPGTTGDSEESQADNGKTCNKPANLGGPVPEYRLVGIIAHKGPSTHCGHYVAYVYHEDKWILFNDSKVVHAPSPDTKDAYVYIFQRM